MWGDGCVLVGGCAGAMAVREWAQAVACAKCGEQGPEEVGDKGQGAAGSTLTPSPWLHFFSYFEGGDFFTYILGYSTVGQ